MRLTHALPVVLFASACLAQPQYRVTVIPVLNPTSPYDFARPTGINDEGDIVGFVGASGNVRAFRWREGQAQPTALGTPPGLSNSDSIPVDINNAGVIIGNAGGHAWKLEGGQYTVFPQFVSGRPTNITGLNDAGGMVGTANDSTFTGTRAVRFTGAGLEPIFNENSSATGINELGHIIGSKVGGPYLFDPSQNQITYIPPPSANLTYRELADVNNNGMVVGNVTGPQVQTRYALVWTAAGGSQTLPPQGVHNYAMMVNDQGVVAGRSQNTGSGDFAWIWTQAHGLLALNTRLELAPGQSFSVWFPGAINELGQIAAVGSDLNTGDTVGLLLTPTDLVPTCYANCDGSTAAPVLNVADFSCFLQKFAAGDPYANCDNSTAAPVLNVADFSCFLQSFASGCR